MSRGCKPAAKLQYFASEPRVVVMFEFNVPAERIAQHPAENRDGSKLLILQGDQLIDRHFRDITQFLQSGDLLILNDTRVLPARLIGNRVSSGGAWEGLYIATHTNGQAEMMTRSGGKLRPGEQIRLQPGGLHLTLARPLNEGRWLVEPPAGMTITTLLEQAGRLPLPPYIRKGREDANDRERYQTVFAKYDGSIAAPTAGLHFTPELLQKLQAMGVGCAYVTLHVGLGTFAAMKSDDPTQHQMHAEWGRVPAETVAAIQQCHGRVIAVGTTSTRILESAALANQGNLAPWEGETRLMIVPPYKFHVIDGLLTNFHLPKTTLLYLVAALAGNDRIERAYRHALANEYRFYSYGDAMLIMDMQ